MAAFSFRVDFPFDGTSAFLQNDKMYYAVHVISFSVWAALSTISLSLNINITVIVHMPHVVSLGGLYYTLYYCHERFQSPVTKLEMHNSTFDTKVKYTFFFF